MLSVLLSKWQWFVNLDLLAWIIRHSDIGDLLQLVARLDEFQDEWVLINHLLEFFLNLWVQWLYFFLTVDLLDRLHLCLFNRGWGNRGSLHHWCCCHSLLFYHNRLWNSFYFWGGFGCLLGFNWRRCLLRSNGLDFRDLDMIFDVLLLRNCFNRLR